MSHPNSRNWQPLRGGGLDHSPHSETPLVTVGIPVFNAAPQIVHTLQHVLSQTYQHLEVLVSDNFSTDGTTKVLSEVDGSDPRLRILYQSTNLGAIRNFNLLLQQASGQFFIWLAHDDIWSPDLLEKCIQVMLENSEVVICQPPALVVARTTPGQVMHVNRLRGFESRVPPLRRSLRVGRMLPATAVYGLFRTEALRRSGGMRVEPGGDLAFFPLLLSGGAAAEVPGAEFRYTFGDTWRPSSEEVSMIMGQTFERKGTSRSLIGSRLRRLLHTRHEWLPEGGWVAAVAEASALFFYAWERITFRIVGLFPEWLKSRSAIFMYWNMIHNPNTEVLDAERYQDRVVLAKV